MTLFELTPCGLDAIYSFVFGAMSVGLLWVASGFINKGGKHE